MNSEHLAKLKSIPWTDVLFYSLLIILLIVIVILIFQFFTKDDVSNFTSNFDNKGYAIRNVGTYENKQDAANYLALLSRKIDDLVLYMKNNNLPNQVIADRLYNRWSNCVLKETSSTDKSVAFTVNKSSEMRICIRPVNGGYEFENPNTAMFVILHELAHVMSVTYGHNEEFKNNFAYITKLASQLGIYHPEDFTNNPRSYCGIVINSTPCSNGYCEAY
jgi:hypothetical protein